jgi:hypothetical protein
MPRCDAPLRCPVWSDSDSATFLIGGEVIPFDKRPGFFGLFGVVRGLDPDLIALVKCSAG